METSHDLTHRENKIEEVSIADLSLTNSHEEDDAVCGTFSPFLFKGRHPNCDEFGMRSSSENSIFGPINGFFYLALSKPTNW